MTIAALCSYFQTIEATASRLSITETLAELFRKASVDEIGKICYLLQGRVVPLYEAVEFGIADKFMIRAIAQAYDVDGKDVLAQFKKTGDLGAAAEVCYHVSKHGSRGAMSVTAVYDRLYALAKESGTGSQEKKIEILARLLSDADALSARYIARIPLDKLRLGFSELTVLDALSWMLGGDKSLRARLEDVYNIRPDIGLLATEVKKAGIGGLAHVRAKVGAPILAALCQRLPDANEMIAKMGRVGVEPKYDGVRVQIHFQMPHDKIQMPKIDTFSRNLENTTEMFPELDEAGKHLNAREVILDSEAVGVDPKTGRLLPFQETTTRKRKYDIAEQRKSVPLKFFVFDILYKDGKDLLGTPLAERRKLLAATVKEGNLFAVSPQIVTDDVAKLRQYHDEQLKKGLEGVVVKKWESPYEPGRKGYHWVKFKEEEGKDGKLTDTIDAVVMGYYLGEGKRVDFGIGAFLVGVRKGETFVTVTKIGTGVSDELWKDLRQKLNKLKAANKPKEYGDVHKGLIPDVWVEPEIVVEVAGDDLTKSPTHGAGLAIRFPRLVRIRTDKSPHQATTTREVLKLYEMQVR